jgi:hypothetical protein
VTNGDPNGLSPDLQYELAIDTQVEKFVEIKQKLTYFLITASVGVILFVADFFVGNLRVKGHFTASSLETGLVMASALAGLATSGFALVNLRLEHRSYERHLGYRYRRKTASSLTKAEMDSWDRLSRWASRCQRAAFATLFVELGLAVAFFSVFFW